MGAVSRSSHVHQPRARCCLLIGLHGWSRFEACSCSTFPVRFVPCAAAPPDILSTLTGLPSIGLLGRGCGSHPLCTYGFIIFRNCRSAFAWLLIDKWQIFSNNFMYWQQNFVQWLPFFLPLCRIAIVLHKAIFSVFVSYSSPFANLLVNSRFESFY